VLGRYRPAVLAAFGRGDAAAEDVRHPDNAATEFSVPAFSTIAIVDLDRLP
jgi:hypothetical protein